MNPKEWTPDKLITAGLVSVLMVLMGGGALTMFGLKGAPQEISSEIKLFLKKEFDSFEDRQDGRYATKTELKEAIRYLESRDAINGKRMRPGDTLYDYLEQ